MKKKESKAKTRLTAKRSGERERERERKSHVRGSRARACLPTCIRIVRHARPRILSGYVHAATLPPLPCARYATQPSPPLHSPPPSPTLRAALSLSLSLSPPPERSPHPRPAGYPPLVSASSVVSRPTATGSRRQRTIYAQLHPNYRNGTTPWVQMVHTGVK